MCIQERAYCIHFEGINHSWFESSLCIRGKLQWLSSYWKPACQQPVTKSEGIKTQRFMEVRHCPSVPALGRARSKSLWNGKMHSGGRAREEGRISGVFWEWLYFGIGFQDVGWLLGDLHLSKSQSQITGICVRLGTSASLSEFLTMSWCFHE